MISITLGLSEIFVFDPPYLYLVLNTIFWASAASTIIFISAKSFLRQDSLTVLLISSGILILAANFLVVGAVLPFSANAAITLGGILFLFGSIVQVVASFVTFNRIDQTNVTDRKKLLILSYIGILSLTGLISTLALANVFPPFFTVSGPTLIRQVGLTLSASFFGLSSMIFGAAYLRSKTPTLLWYALAMGLISIGAFSTLGTKIVGDIPTWSTRIAYYIGTVYIIIAVFKTRVTNINIYDRWAEAFVGNRQQIDALFSKMLNGFAHCRIIVDENGNPIDYIFISANLQFENLTGLKRERIIGKKVTEVLPGIEKDKVDWIGTYGRVALTGVPIQFESYSELLKKWYSISAYSPKKIEFITIFEDITERKKAEEALSKANSQYELLFNSVAEGFANYKIFFDETGKLDLLVLDINPAGAEQSGVKREEQLGKTWRQIWQDIPEEVFDVYRQVYDTGKPRTFEHFSPITKSWYIITVNKSAEDQFAVTFFDITVRKKAEKALKESENLYRTIFDNSQDGFQLIELIYDEEKKPVDFRYLKVNDTFEALTGVKAKDIIGKTAREVFPNFDAVWLEIPQKVVETGTTLHTELFSSLINKYLDLYYFSYGKNKVGTLFRDITERKNLEEKVKKSEHDYRELFNSMNEMFQVLELVYDDKGQAVDFIYREINPASWILEDLSREQMINKRAKELFGVVEDYWLEALNQVNMTGKPTQLANYSGAIDRYYDVYIWKVTDSQNKVAIIFTDITARKKLEKELSNKETLATIGATAGMVGHDIRNPLQAIIGDIYLAKQDVATLSESDAKENLQENLEAIEENVAYINKIVLDLQDYARPIKPIAKKIDIKPLIEMALQSKRIPKNVETYYHIDDDANIVCTDPDLLKRILNNLGSNAVQAMPNGGKIFVNVAKNDEDILISIEDTGVGIPEELKPKLFQPMMTTKSKGQGFGLAVVKRLTEALGGIVTFESEVGKGTKFIIRLPAQQH